MGLICGRCCSQDAAELDQHAHSRSADNAPTNKQRNKNDANSPLLDEDIRETQISTDAYGSAGAKDAPQNGGKFRSVASASIASPSAPSVDTLAENNNGNSDSKEGMEIVYRKDTIDENDSDDDDSDVTKSLIADTNVAKQSTPQRLLIVSPDEDLHTDSEYDAETPAATDIEHHVSFRATNGTVGSGNSSSGSGSSSESENKLPLAKPDPKQVQMHLLKPGHTVVRTKSKSRVKISRRTMHDHHSGEDMKSEEEKESETVVALHLNDEELFADSQVGSPMAGIDESKQHLSESLPMELPSADDIRTTKKPAAKHKRRSSHQHKRSRRHPHMPPGGPRLQRSHTLPASNTEYMKVKIELLTRFVNACDDDGTGFLELSEARQILEDMMHSPKNIAEAMLDIKCNLDHDHSGQVSADLFWNFYMTRFLAGTPPGIDEHDKAPPKVPRQSTTMTLGTSSAASTKHQYLLPGRRQYRILVSPKLKESPRLKPLSSSPIFRVMLSSNNLPPSSPQPNLKSISEEQALDADSAASTLLEPKRSNLEVMRHRASRRSLVLERKRLAIVLEMYVDRDGSVDRSALDEIWNEMGDEIGNRTVEDCKREVFTKDKERLNKVNKNELSIWWYEVKKEAVRKQSRMREILDSIDESLITKTFDSVSEGTGQITFTQFCYALEDLKIKWGIDEAKEAFRKLDPHRDKVITYDSFKTCLFDFNEDQMESFWLRLLGLEESSTTLHGREDLRTEEDIEPTPDNVDDGSATMTSDEIFQLIHTKSSDWRQRLKALECCGTMFCDDTTISTVDFGSQFQRFVQPLILQIKERRSTVCRTSCDRTAKIAEYRKQAFYPFARIFLEELFTIVRVNIQIMSDSGHKCCLSIVNNVTDDPSSEEHVILDTIASGMRQKFAAVRKSSLIYLHQILEKLLQNEKKNLESESYINKIESMIEKGVSDADGSVRTEAFRTLGYFSLLDDARTNRVIEAMSRATRERYAQVTGLTPEPMPIGGQAQSMPEINTSKKGKRIKKRKGTVKKRKRPGIKQLRKKMEEEKKAKSQPCGATEDDDAEEKPV